MAAQQKSWQSLSLPMKLTGFSLRQSNNSRYPITFVQNVNLTWVKESYDYVIPMPTFTSANRSNLALLQRPDLALTLTKINLWRLVQFRKCVYVDADILALRAPDELFTLDTDFAVPSRRLQVLTLRRHLMLVGQTFSIPYFSSSLSG
jgi:hypothetical protein